MKSGKFTDGSDYIVAPELLEAPNNTPHDRLITTSGQMVWCVLCVEISGGVRVHIFSSPKLRKEWVDAQPDVGTYIHYDYVIDYPERMDGDRAQ